MTAIGLAPAARGGIPAAVQAPNPAWRTAWLAFRREEVRARRRFAMAWVFPVVPPLVTVTLFADLTGSVAQLPAFPAATYFDWLAAGAVLLPGMMGAGFTAVGWPRICGAGCRNACGWSAPPRRR